MSWTDERVEMLKQMWNEGKSASQIAKELGSVTPNAVIGKVHCLGLSNRTTAPKPVKEAAAKPEPKKKPVEKAEPKPAPETKQAAPAEPPRQKPIIPAGQPLPPQPIVPEVSEETLANVRALEEKAKKLSLLQLTERTCKWPIGDPATEEFWFCGHPSAPGKPYCETHVQLAFQPPSSRRDRRASR